MPFHSELPFSALHKAKFRSGLFANLPPTPEGTGDVYWATDSNGGNGELYIGDQAGTAWVKFSPSSPVESIGDIEDVTITAPSTGQALIYSSVSGNWSNGTVAKALSELTDVNLAGLLDGNTIVWDIVSSKWVPSTLDGTPPDASVVTYTPLTLTNWTSSTDPGEVNEALDQLASRLKTNEGVASKVRVSSGDTTSSYLQEKLVAGSNIQIVLNNVGGNETLTLSASTGAGGGVSELDELTDVTITLPIGGEFLKFDGTSEAWVNSTVSLSNISDVIINNPTDGQIMSYNDFYGAWVNQNPPTIINALSDLSDVNLSTLSDGEILRYDAGTFRWINAAAPTGGSSAISDLTDVNLGTLSDGEILSYDAATSKWVNSTPSGGSLAITDLTDVNIVSLSDGEILSYDAATSKWVNSAPSGGPGGSGPAIRSIYLELPDYSATPQSVTTDTLLNLHSSQHIVRSLGTVATEIMDTTLDVLTTPTGYNNAIGSISGFIKGTLSGSSSSPGLWIRLVQEDYGTTPSEYNGDIELWNSIGSTEFTATFNVPLYGGSKGTANTRKQFYITLSPSGLSEFSAIWELTWRIYLRWEENA